MQSAICATSDFDTSSIRPRPNWATLPATVKSVLTTTCEPPSASRTCIFAVARALPGPVVSRPSPESVAVRLASSRSMIRAVPA